MNKPTLGASSSWPWPGTLDARASGRERKVQEDLRSDARPARGPPAGGTGGTSGEGGGASLGSSHPKNPVSMVRPAPPLDIPGSVQGFWICGSKSHMGSPAPKKDPTVSEQRSSLTKFDYDYLKLGKPAIQRHSMTQLQLKNGLIRQVPCLGGYQTRPIPPVGPTPGRL